jgi:hypothetical protein
VTGEIQSIPVLWEQVAQTPPSRLLRWLRLYLLGTARALKLCGLKNLCGQGEERSAKEKRFLLLIPLNSKALEFGA